jgi:hypothetical protein
MNENSPLQDDFETAFDNAFARLRANTVEACAGDAEWPARIAAAVAAVLEFAVSEPAAIRVLTLDALLDRGDEGRRYRELIESFAELLRAEAPRDARQPALTEYAIVGGIGSVIVNHILAGTLEELQGEAPQLVEFVLQPYLDFAKVARQRRSSDR